MEYDLHSHVKVVQAIAPAALTAAPTPVVIDTVGYESLEFIINTGTLGAGTSVPVIEASEDDGSGAPDGTWDAVPADLIQGAPEGSADGEFGTIDAANDDDSVFRVGVISKRRHVRLTLPETTTWTSFLLGAVALLGNPKRAPEADQNPA